MLDLSLLVHLPVFRPGHSKGTFDGNWLMFYQTCRHCKSQPSRCCSHAEFQPAYCWVKSVFEKQFQDFKQRRRLPENQQRDKVLSEGLRCYLPEAQVDSLGWSGLSGRLDLLVGAGPLVLQLGEALRWCLRLAFGKD